MATVNEYGSSLNANFKETYGDDIKNLIPEELYLYNEVKMLSKEKQPGLNFNQPVILGHEHGITFASSDDDAFNLNSSIAGSIKNATVKGYPSVFRSQIGYNAAQRAVQGGKQAFEDATKFVIANMLRSYTKKLEIEMLYGQMGYATVASVAALVITITTAEFAAGIWAGAEGMPLEIRDSAGTTIRGNCTVTAVDLTARTVTVDVMPGGTTATDVIWHKGAYGNEFAGIHKILTNTSTIFGIDASAYSLWKGNTVTAGGAALTLAKIEKALVPALHKGLMGKVTCLINENTWKDLLSEQTALRMYDQSYSKAQLVNGGEALKFWGPNGEIMVKASPFVKEGYAYLLKLEDFVKVGSTDVTFKNPVNKDEYFIHRQDAAAFELRAYCDWAIFTATIGHNVLINNVTNS